MTGVKTVAELSNHEIYEEGVRTLVRAEFEPETVWERRLERLYDEAERRDSRIWDYVYQDFEARISALHAKRPEPAIRRIDLMTLNELKKYLLEFGGWQSARQTHFASIMELTEPDYTLITAKGDSMKPEIDPNDILIVHTTSRPNDGDIIIGGLAKQNIIKRYRNVHDGIILDSTNTKYGSMFRPHGDVTIYGVVEYIVKKVRGIQ